MTPGHEGYDMEKILFRSHYLTQSIWARDDASFVVHIEIIESIDQEIVNSTVHRSRKSHPQEGQLHHSRVEKRCSAACGSWGYHRAE
jgi:hypothetical protein